MKFGLQRECVHHVCSVNLIAIGESHNLKFLLLLATSKTLSSVKPVMINISWFILYAVLLIKCLTYRNLS